MTPDLAALRAAFASDPAFAAVFASLARGPAVRVVSVQRVAQGGRQSRLALVPEPDVRRVFTQLAAWGFGEFLQPGNQRLARLSWRVQPRAVQAIAEGRMDALAEAHWFPAAGKSESAPAPAPAGPSPMPPAWERHRLPLAPGREVELVFPPDLAADEGRWIGDYLETLRPQSRAAGPEKPTQRT